MAGYTFNATAAYTSTLIGGNMTPAMPTFSAGNLLLLETGINSTSVAAPSISGWTILSPNTNQHDGILYGRIAQVGDTSPVFQWNGTSQAYSRITSFAGDVYTDLTTIVDKSSDRTTSAAGAIAVLSLAAPTNSNCLVIRGGRCVKSSVNNGKTFNDWGVNSGLFTKIGSTELVQSGSALAAAMWYWLQTTPTSTSTDTAALNGTGESSLNTMGFTVALKPAVPFPPGWQAL